MMNERYIYQAIRNEEIAALFREGFWQSWKEVRARHVVHSAACTMLETAKNQPGLWDETTIYNETVKIGDILFPDSEKIIPNLAER
jgi:hypothetical protein